MASLQWRCWPESWWIKSKQYFILYLLLSFFSIYLFVRELGFLSFSLGVATLHITQSLNILFCKGAWISLLAFRCNDPTYNPSYCILHQWFAPTTWHAHNCEWTSSDRILNISCQIPVVGVSTDGMMTVIWTGAWWPPILPQYLCL